MKKLLVTAMAGLILAAPTLKAEDCVRFNWRTTAVKYVSGDWKIVDGNHWMFSFGNKRREAYKALQVIKAYKLGYSCFVGRPNPSMQYHQAHSGKG